MVAGTPNRMFDLKEADPQNVNVKRSAVPKEQLEAVIPTLEDQISQESKFHDPVQEDQENAKHDTEEKNHHLNENEEHFGREFWRYRNTDENDNHHTNFDDSSSEISTKEHGISHDSSSNNSDGIEENDGMWYSDSASSESGWDPSDEDSYSIESAENWFKRPGQHHILYLNHHHDHHHHQDDEDQDVHEAIHQHFHLTISDDQLYGMLGLGPIHGVIPHDEDFSSSDESDEAKNRYSVASQHHDLFGEIEFPQHVHFDRHSHRGPFFNEHLESRGHHKNVHLQYHDHDHEHSSEEGLIVPTKHHLSKHGHRWSHAYRSDSDGNSDEDHDFGTDGHQQKERRHGHSKIHSNRHHHLEEHGRHHDHIRNEDDDDHHEVSMWLVSIF